MFTTILVPTDGSELAEKALTAAIEFASRNNGRLVGLCVVEPYPFSAIVEPSSMPDPARFQGQAQEYARANVDRIAEAAAAAGVPCETVTAFGSDPADEIVNTAQRHGCDLIFIATHGRKGLDRILLGSVTQKVLAKSSLPVLVFR